MQTELGGEVGSQWQPRILRFERRQSSLAINIVTADKLTEGDHELVMQIKLASRHAHGNQSIVGGFGILALGISFKQRYNRAALRIFSHARAWSRDFSNVRIVLEQLLSLWTQDHRNHERERHAHAK